MAYEYVRKFYKVPAAPGVRVKVRGDDIGRERQGVIVRKRHYDHYVYVKFDGQKHNIRVHPLDLIYEL